MLQELKTELIETLTYNNGRRLVERTRAGDVAVRFQPVKSSPSLELVFDPDIATNKSFQSIMDSPAKGFEFRVLDGVTETSGVIVTGSGWVEGGQLDLESPTGNASLRATIRPDGSEWLRVYSA